MPKPERDSHVRMHAQLFHELQQLAAHTLDSVRLCMLELRNEVRPSSMASLNDFAKMVRHIAERLQCTIDLLHDTRTQQPTVDTVLDHFQAVASDLKALAGSAESNTEIEEWIRDTAPNVLLRVRADLDRVRSQMLEGISVDTTTELRTASDPHRCGDAELVFEIHVPDTVSDDRLLSELLDVALKGDALHRALGGNGLKVKHLEVYEESFVPEVQHG